jgi:hypothetical protein
MQERADIASEQAVRALNSIDLVFINEKIVRDCWSQLYQILCKRTDDSTSEEKRLVESQEGAIKSLLIAMAGSLNLSDKLTPDDFNRVYFPDRIAVDRRLRYYQQKQAIDILKEQTTQAN